MKILNLILILAVPIFFFGCLTAEQNIEQKPDISKPSLFENETSTDDEHLQNLSLCNCNLDQDCINGECVLKKGCNYNNPACGNEQKCMDNICKEKSECSFNSDCPANYLCKNNSCQVYCTKNSQCQEDEICKNEECIKVECKLNSDCNSLTKQCVGYECIESNKCNFDLECGQSQVCLNQQCHNVVNCTIGECEDDYFRLEYATYEDKKTERSVSATIYPKTLNAAVFRIVWNEPEYYGYLSSVEKSFNPTEKFFRFLIIQYPEFQQTEHYLIEYVGEPNILYLVWQSPIELEEN